MTIVLHLVVICILLVIALTDAKTMIIPNSLSLSILICGVLAIFVTTNISLLERVVGALCVSVPLFIITMISTDSFGGGDIKLMAAAGFLLGWQSVLVAAAIGIIIGGAYGIYLLVTKKKTAREHFAFGPALCAGIALTICSSYLV